MNRDHPVQLADVTEGEWGVKEETNDKIRYNAFTVTINNPLAKTAKIDETQVRPIDWSCLGFCSTMDQQ